MVETPGTLPGVFLNNQLTPGTLPGVWLIRIKTPGSVPGVFLLLLIKQWEMSQELTKLKKHLVPGILSD